MLYKEFGVVVEVGELSYRKLNVLLILKKVLLDVNKKFEV